MKTKIISVIALFALLVLTTILVAVPNEAKTVEETPNVYNIDDPYVQTLIVCTRYCSWCVKYGNYGACTTAGGCC
ncbi:MAG: hypothetical protein WC755_08980 [Candidatus Woesearchaeota archaeon]|jgi:hypothetical protein